MSTTSSTPAPATSSLPTPLKRRAGGRCFSSSLSAFLAASTPGVLFHPSNFDLEHDIVVGCGPGHGVTDRGVGMNREAPCLNLGSSIVCEVALNCEIDQIGCFLLRGNDGEVLAGRTGNGVDQDCLLTVNVTTQASMPLALAYPLAALGSLQQSMRMSSGSNTK